MSNYNVTETTGVPIKAWTNGVPVEDAAAQQLKNVASLPFIYRWVAAMPDVHWGMGATVGSVIPTQRAIIPAAVGVDIGCGMMAVKTNLTASDLPDSLAGIRSAVECFPAHLRQFTVGTKVAPRKRLKAMFERVDQRIAVDHARVDIEF